ncbi:MAG: ATP-binding protein [Gammaproteobacteria bacterium]
MKRPGIKYQILLITLIPVFLIDLVFTYTSFKNNIEQASDLLQIRGQAAASRIASASEIILLSGNKQRIHRLLDQSIDTGAIIRASVYDLAGRLVVQSTSTDFDEAKVSSYFYFRQPILRQILLSQNNQPPVEASANDSANLPAKSFGWVHIEVSSRQLDLVKARITRDSIGFFVIVLLLAIVLSSIISARITRPVYNLIKHLKRVETGHLGEIIEPVADNEIGALQNGFNQMTRALLSNRKQLNNRIEQATLQLSDANTEMETRNRELGLARDEAQNASRIKSEFLANMSHEIRTPINAIKGFISLMSRSELNPTQKKYADIIVKSTSDLTSIINEILDFSKMESGKLKVVVGDFDLHEVIEQARDILFVNILKKNIDLNLIIYSDTPRYVCGDRLRIKQILLNLIGNAIKFTDQGEVVIRVSVEEQTAMDTRILISVEDTGIGISETDQANLFTAFSQVESANNRRFTGTGLGLVISQKLAHLISGNISLQSEPGKGSLFSFHFPLALAHSATQAPVVSNNDNQTVLIFATRKGCLQEVQTLFERAGILTETVLLNEHRAIRQISDSISQNQMQLDYIAFDFRHFNPDLSGVLDASLRERIRIIAMHYDRSMIANASCQGLEFVSIINSSNNLENILSRSSDEVQESRLTEQLQHAPGQPKHVLIVDDNKINLELASELIRIWGHEVSAAGDAGQAMEIYKKQVIDLIILDIQMPDIDGITLLSMMREEKPDDDTAIVALTANILDNAPEQLLELGFDYYLSKPIDEEKFRSLVDGSLKRGGTGLDSIPGEGAQGDELSVDFRESLALSADNDSLLKKIFGILLKEIPEHQQQLSSAAAQPDYVKLSEIVHKIHGITCYTSLPRLKKLTVSVQQQLTQESFTRVDSAIEAMIKELDKIKDQVEEFYRTADDTGD